MGDQQVLDFKMASRKGCLSINEVIAALGEENDSEIDSDSSSELDESTDDSADETWPMLTHASKIHCFTVMTMFIK